jgi:hypothetical protein
MIQIRKIEGGKWNDVEFVSGRMIAYGTADTSKPIETLKPSTDPYGYVTAHVDHAPDQISFDAIILGMVEDSFSYADATGTSWVGLLPLNIEIDEDMTEEVGYVGTLEDGRTIWFREDVGADDFSKRTISFHIFNYRTNKGAK